jgi:hypothetical protein
VLPSVIVPPHSYTSHFTLIITLPFFWICSFVDFFFTYIFFLLSCLNEFVIPKEMSVFEIEMDNTQKKESE